MAKRKYIVLDTETAPTPEHPKDGVHAEHMRVYDCSWIVTDDSGEIYAKRSFIVRETFLNDSLMRSAYYYDKMPQYVFAWQNGSMIMADMCEIWRAFKADIALYQIRDIWAYNAFFDMVALNATIRDYSRGFQWYFVPYGVNWRCIMQYAKSDLTKSKHYIAFCKTTGNVTATGKPRATAELVYQFVSKDTFFVEAHTGLADALIEADILRAVRKRNGSRVPKPLNKRNK